MVAEYCYCLEQGVDIVAEFISEKVFWIITYPKNIKGKLSLSQKLKLKAGETAAVNPKFKNYFYD